MSNEYKDMMDEDPLNRFFLDPDAVEWARRPVEKIVAKYRNAYENSDDKEKESAQFCRKVANVLERELLGGGGCNITAFDKRGPELRRKFRGEG